MLCGSFTIFGRTMFRVAVGWLLVGVLPLLPQAEARAGNSLPIEAVLALCEAENDVVRAFWTKEMVGPGMKAGLAFSGDWHEGNVEAGPLPALFLRETAVSLERNPIRLDLRLGSDFPIEARNRFEGVQLAAFQMIKNTGQPQFFRSRDTQLYTAMFPDVAVAEPCVSCHNAHEQSPKHDWRLNDVMGATTWTYPSKTVTTDELADMLMALRGAVREAYAAYIEKASTFSEPPVIGDKWPRDGYYLPTVDVFIEEVSRLIPTLDSLGLDESGRQSQ